jgi:hypothetical protein
MPSFKNLRLSMAPPSNVLSWTALVICRTEPHKQALSLNMPCPIPLTTSFYMAVPPLKAPCCHNSGMLPSRLSGICEPNALLHLPLEAAAT